MYETNQARREDLAAAFRLVHEHGWTDLTSTHISVRMDNAEHFLTNSRHQLFNQITASSLIELDHDSNMINGQPESIINKAGFIIHSAIHGALPDVGCVLHTHSIAGMAIASLPQGLLPMSQHALRFYNNVGYHEYEGVVLDPKEQASLIADLGNNEALILRNHGLLTVGRDVAEAFSAMYYLEKACQSQLAAMAASNELHLPSQAVCEHTRQQYADYTGYMQIDWRALRTQLDQSQPDYKS